jgi:hypothetical protein
VYNNFQNYSKHSVRKLRNISVPVDLQLKLFDTLILPILTYGCEVWGYENVQVLEKVHLQYKFPLEEVAIRLYHFCINWSVSFCFNVSFNSTK